MKETTGKPVRWAEFQKKPFHECLGYIRRLNVYELEGYRKYK
jgi:hypothetical protein